MLMWFTVLLCFQLAGELTVAALGLPMPGPVIGMSMLFVFLAIRRAVPEPLSAVGSNLLSHLSLLFVPAGVGIMAHFNVLEAEWPVLIVALVASTLLAIATTAGVMMALKRWMGLP
jgi:holin-like protein